MKGKKIYIAPSIERADWLNLEKEIKNLEKAEVDILHIDIMDRTYGETILFSPKIIPEIKEITTLPLDVHLYVSDPEQYFPIFFEHCQNDYINIEVEAVNDISRLLSLVRENKCKPAISLAVGTSISSIDELIGQVDLINLLVRNAGFSHLSIEKNILLKLKRVRNLIEESNREILLEVDGSIGFDDSIELVKHGADVLVLGSKVIFRRNVSYFDSVKLLKERLKKIC